MFTAGFANITKLVTQLMEETWTFQRFLKELGMGPILGYPQPGKKFIVNMEASSVGKASVLNFNDLKIYAWMQLHFKSFLRTWLGPLEQVMTHILRNQDLMYKYH
jgi:hypothetical protein